MKGSSTNTDTVPDGDLAGAPAPEADRQPCRAERRKRDPRPSVPEARRVHKAMTLHVGERDGQRPWITVYRWLTDKDGTNPVPAQCVALAQSDERKARKARRRAVTAARRHNRGQRATGGTR